MWYFLCPHVQFYYILLEGAFACFGVLLLGTHYYPMKHAFTAMEALTSSTVGHIPGSDHLEKHYPAWWPVFVVAHMIAVLVFLTSLVRLFGLITECPSQGSWDMEGLQYIYEMLGCNSDSEPYPAPLVFICLKIHIHIQGFIQFFC